MRETLQEVLLLQKHFTTKNTEEMRRRGKLVRTDLAEEISALLPLLATHSQVDDLKVKGKDGTGNKTEIPWIRVHSAEKSPHPTDGWYLVYLFSAGGDRVYLSLNQGTTQLVGAQFRPQPEKQVKARADWARKQIGALPRSWSPSIKLDNIKSDLGTFYEWGNIAAVAYSSGSIPPDEVLKADLLQSAEWLGMLYRANAELYAPGDPPEIADAIAAAEAVAAPRKQKGGFAPRLSAKQRKAIEERAVTVATEHFTSPGMGYAVEDVGKNKSYDLHATKDGTAIHVEVKGTTSRGAEIVLTRNEVELHKDKHPHNALAIVHGIQLTGTKDEPSATGGTLTLRMPWQLDESRLSPIAYQYSTGL